LDASLAEFHGLFRIFGSKSMIAQPPTPPMMQPEQFNLKLKASNLRF
jgi:hypothetical protein